MRNGVSDERVEIFTVAVADLVEKNADAGHGFAARRLMKGFLADDNARAFDLMEFFLGFFGHKRDVHDDLQLGHDFHVTVDDAIRTMGADVLGLRDYFLVRR